MAKEGTFLARCTKRFAPIVVRNVRFPSNQQKVDRFTAESASRSTDQREEAHRAIRWTGSGGFSRWSAIAFFIFFIFLISRLGLIL